MRQKRGRAPLPHLPDGVWPRIGPSAAGRHEGPEQLPDRLDLGLRVVERDERPEGPLGDGAAVGRRRKGEDDLLRLVGELEEVEELGDAGPGDAHPGGQGGLGLQEQPLDGRRPDGAGALGVEGGGVLLVEEGLLAVPGAPDVEGEGVLEAGSILVSVGFGEPLPRPFNRAASAAFTVGRRKRRMPRAGRAARPTALRPKLRIASIRERIRGNPPLERARSLSGR